MIVVMKPHQVSGVWDSTSKNTTLVSAPPQNDLPTAFMAFIYISHSPFIQQALSTCHGELRCSRFRRRKQGPSSHGVDVLVGGRETCVRW